MLFVLSANSGRYYLHLKCIVVYYKTVCNNNNIFSVIIFIEFINWCCLIRTLLSLSLKTLHLSL